MFSDLVFQLHIYVSLLSLLSAVLLMVRSVRGWVMKLEYHRTDRWLAIIFLVSMYLQLILGVASYLSLDSRRPDEMLSPAEAMETARLRFWAIEHIALMVFALFLSQTGWVVIRRIGRPVNRFRNAVFYFGGALLVILYSLLMVFIKK